MTIDQILDDLANIFCGKILCQCSILIDIGFKTLAIDVFHNVVGCTVLLEDIVDMDDIGVVELGDSLSLLDKLSLKGLHNLSTALRAERYATSVIIAVVVLLREELLDAYLALSHDLLGKVGDAKTTTADGLHNTILAALQQCATL